MTTNNTSLSIKLYDPAPARDAECACGYFSLPRSHIGTLVLCPLTSLMLLLSDQLMYQRVPAVVPTMPMSIVLSKAALTVVPSNIISCSNTTMVPLKDRHRWPKTRSPLLNRDMRISVYHIQPSLAGSHNIQKWTIQLIPCRHIFCLLIHDRKNLWIYESVWAGSEKVA